jgi:hypothetical protein
MVALYFFVVIALPVALGVYVAAQGMHRSRRCPACAGETLRIRSRAYRLLSVLLPSTQLQRRWCMGCGWQGVARLRRSVHPPSRVTSSREQTRDQVDIRRLEIDGRTWKVMIQCWAEGGHWLGRLLFVGPDGQSHKEEQSSIQGDSALEVLAGALSIPDKALAGRIRRAIH